MNILAMLTPNKGKKRNVDENNNKNMQYNPDEIRAAVSQLNNPGLKNEPRKKLRALHDLVKKLDTKGILDLAELYDFRYEPDYNIQIERCSNDDEKATVLRNYILREINLVVCIGEFTHEELMNMANGIENRIQNSL